LAKAGKDASVKADALSSRIDRNHDTTANLNAVLLADTDETDVPQNSTSFASQIDTGTTRGQGASLTPAGVAPRCGR
jgi:hypothetical protein